jgi:hypothetical protein
MLRSATCFVIGGAFALMLLATGSLSAQFQPVPVAKLDDNLKNIVVAHYTGKQVKLRLPIPATKQGLEIVDGLPRLEPNKTPPSIAAQLGDDLTIKRFVISANRIDVWLTSGIESGEKSEALSPHVTLKFSQELTTSDLALENLNRILSMAFVLDPTTAAVAEQASIAGPTVADAKPPQPTIIRDLISVPPTISELTVESSVAEARIYIDGGYSGPAPRTVRLRAGVHAILVVSNGYENWEAKLDLPGAKASLVRVELQPKRREELQ